MLLRVFSFASPDDSVNVKYTLDMSYLFGLCYIYVILKIDRYDMLFGFCS